MTRAAFSTAAAVLVLSLAGCSANHWNPPPRSANWSGPLSSPSGIREALLVFDEVMPEVTNATVSFTSSPIIDGDRLLAAKIESLDPISLTVLAQGDVQDTALVYIAVKAYWLAIKGLDGEGTPEFDAFIASTNDAITAARQ